MTNPCDIYVSDSNWLTMAKVKRDAKGRYVSCLKKQLRRVRKRRKRGKRGRKKRRRRRQRRRSSRSGKRRRRRGYSMPRGGHLPKNHHGCVLGDGIVVHARRKR